jgi:hypothetical protein
MSKTLTVKIGYEVFITSVVNKDYVLDPFLKLLFAVIDKKRDENRKFGRVVGLGIEKSFSTSTIDGSVVEKVAVLKPCAGNFCFLVDLLHLKEIPTSLHKFLDLSDIMIVGVGIKQSLCDLRRDRLWYSM